MMHDRTAGRPFRALVAVAVAAATAVAAAVAGCRPPPPAGPPPQPYAVALVRAEGSSGPRLTVPPGTVVVLDGTASGSAGGGAELTYRWRQTAGPEVRPARTDLARAEVRLVREGRHVFELTVSCSGTISVPSPVEIEVRRGAVVRAESDPPPETGAAPRRTGADFALLDSDAAELVRVFGEKTGLTLRADAQWRRPEDLARMPVTLMARGVSPGVALELAARLTGSRYVRDGAESALLCSGAGPLRSERQQAHFYPTGGLHAPGRGEALEELAVRACRAALDAGPGSSVGFDARLEGLHAVGPSSMHRRIVALLEAVNARGRGLPARPPLEADERLRAATLGRKLDLVLIDAEPGRAALELGAALGVPVAFAPRPPGAPGRPPRLSLRGAGRSAAEVLAEAAGLVGAGGFSWVRGGAVFIGGDGQEPPGAEGPWAGSEVRAYPAAGLRAVGVLPGAAAHHLRAKVFPPLWRDQAALCTHYEPTDRLVVIAPPEVQTAVLRELHDLIEESAKKKRK